MKYDDIAALFLVPLPEPPLAPTLPASAARRLRDSMEPIATQGWWSRPAGDGFDRLGLSFLPGYVWGRAAALGEPTPAVVVAAFGVFESALVATGLEAGRATASREDVLAARSTGGSSALDAVTDADEADAVASIVLRATDALDPLGRSLFAALRELPLPESPGGRLWRAAELVREHRGDGHLAAIVAAGLDAVEANVLTELWLGFGLGEYTATRGFGPDAIGSAAQRLGERGWLDDGGLTDEGHRARLLVEEATDRSQEALVASLGTQLGDVVAAAERIDERLLTERWAPSDPRKRAAG